MRQKNIVQLTLAGSALAMTLVLVGCTKLVGDNSPAGTDSDNAAVSADANTNINVPGAGVTNAPVNDGDADNATANIKTFLVNGTNFSFDPSVIQVKKGDIVRITFQDDDGFHNLVVDGYGVSTANIQTGQQSVIQFTADKVGTFAYYCGIGSHREKGMEGKLIVE